MIAVYTLEHSTKGPLVEHGTKLHDQYFLPSPLWADLQGILADLKAAGFDLPVDGFREIWQWRFPLMLAADLSDGATLEIRRACEGWPLLSETPSEGGSTSRFVDTSIERLEFAAPPGFADRHRLFVNGRELRLVPLPGATGSPEAAHDHSVGCGLRYRRTALFPSLHPGILPQLPLEVAVTGPSGRKVRAAYRLRAEDREFQAVEPKELTRKIEPKNPAVKPEPGLLTYDLRL